MNETSIESQGNVLAAISDFHNYGSRQTKNASKTTLTNNASAPNTKLPSNENNIDLCGTVTFKVGEYYLCPKCKKTFHYLKNLKRHVKSTHPCLTSTLFPPGNHKCNICEKSFKSLRSLQNHNRISHRSHEFQKHGECPENCKFHKQHKCPLCTETLRITKISEHFEKNHNLLLKPITLNFESYEKFCEWKKAIERVTKSYFVKHSSRETNGNKRHTFSCHRSGNFKSKVKKNERKLKTQGSRKMNAYCPAVMKVLVRKEGKCEVKFQSQHLGHENETKHLNLTYEERIYIAEKLATNLPLSDILNDIKNSALKDRAERLCLLTRKDLHNIKASLLKDRQSYLSAAKLDEKLTKDLRDIHDKHAESEHVKADITQIEKGWLLTFIEHNEIYLIKENSKSCDCPLVCVYCKVCVKSYVCNCSDSYVEGNMCKHIHFFCMERNKMFDTPNSDDHFDCDNDMSEITFNSEQYDSLQPSTSGTLTPAKISGSCKNNNFVDSEKRCALKNKFSCLIDSLKNEEEYRLFENTIEDLATKLKSVHTQSQDKNNVVSPATNHPIETVYINENTEDQHNLIRAANHSFQTGCRKKNIKDQHNQIPTATQPLSSARVIEQDQHNPILAMNHPFKAVSVNNNNKQDQLNSNSKRRNKNIKDRHNPIPTATQPLSSARVIEQDQHNPILATNHPFKAASVNNNNKQDQLNSNSKQINIFIPATTHPIETANINENTQDQQNLIHAINHPSQTVYLEKNTQDQQNSILATNHPLDTERVIDNKQNQHNSYSQKTTNRPLLFKMLKPIEGGHSIYYIHFAKAKNKQ